MSANENNLAGQLQSFTAAFVRESLNDCMPAKIVSYDRETNRAVVQPLVMLGTTTGEKVSRARLVEIPVMRLGGGGFFISVPLVEGDTGWIKATDRDLSLIKQAEWQEDWPNTKRMHSFSDAWFIPDRLADWVIDAKNADALVIQSADGSTCIALDNGRVEIDAANMILNGDVEINGDITHDGSMTCTGDISADGDMSASGDISADGDVKADASGAGVALTTHLHTGNLGAPTSPPTAGT